MDLRCQSNGNQHFAISLVLLIFVFFFSDLNFSSMPFAVLASANCLRCRLRKALSRTTELTTLDYYVSIHNFPSYISIRYRLQPTIKVSFAPLKIMFTTKPIQQSLNHEMKNFAKLNTVHSRTLPFTVSIIQCSNACNVNMGK